MEHLEHILSVRVKRKAPEEKKYKYFAHLPAHSAYFIPQLFGCTKETFDREQLLIQVVPFRANQKGPNLERHITRSPRILPSWKRARIWIVAETAQERVARLNVTNIPVGVPDSQVEPVPTWGLLPFASLYVEEQCMTVCRDSTEGPVDIFADTDGANKLLVLYLGTKARQQFKLDVPRAPKTVWMRAYSRALELPNDATRKSILHRL